MQAHILRVRSQDILAARPRGHALGLLVGDLLVTMHVARERQLPLLLLEREETRDSPLLRLECAGIVAVNGAVRGAAMRRWRTAVVRDAAVDAAADAAVNAWNAAVNWARRRCQAMVIFHSSPHPLSIASIITRRRQRHPPQGRVPSPRNLVKLKGGEVMQRLEAAKWHRSPRSVYESHDLRKYAAQAPLGARLSAGDEEEARRAAAAAGVPDDRMLIAMHVRGSAAGGAADRGKDAIRNADVASYIPAVNALVARGFTVVRIGDSSMPPLQVPGVIDLASQPRNPLLHFWCVSRSRFFLAGDSGPYLLSWLFGTPCLAVNIVNVLGVYPLRAHDRYIVKRVRERSTGRTLPFEEMLDEKFVYGFRLRLLKEASIELIDNTADEIRDAAVEMADALETPAPPTPRQLRFRALVSQARAGSISQSKLFEKVGRSDSYLGDGWVSDSFVARE